VPTAIICTFALSALSFGSLVKARRPAATLLRTIASRPGSKMGISPRFNRSIFFGSTSRQSTWFPTSARHAPVTRPT
jgi:hypothetical protein